MACVQGERLSPTTARDYRRLAKTIISPALGSMPIGKIKDHQLDALYAGLVKERGLSPSSVRQVHAVIRSSLNQAVKWGWLSANPAVKATPPAVRRSEIVPPDIGTALRLLAAAEEREPEFAIPLVLSSIIRGRGTENPSATSAGVLSCTHCSNVSAMPFEISA